MNSEKFGDKMVDILSSGYGEFGDWKKSELTGLFENLDKDELEKMLVEFYTEEYGVDEGVGGEELNWVGEYLGKKPVISFQ